MSWTDNNINITGREIINQLEKTRPVWGGSKYHDRILKSLYELDTAWQIGAATPFNQIVMELKRLVGLAICEEFLSAKKAVRILLPSSNIEFWLIPAPKAAKDLRVSIPWITAIELVELLENPPDHKTFGLILSARKMLSGMVRSKLP